jgi:hypothetical protein
VNCLSSNAFSGQVDPWTSLKPGNLRVIIGLHLILVTTEVRMLSAPEATYGKTGEYSSELLLLACCYQEVSRLGRFL